MYFDLFPNIEYNFPTYLGFDVKDIFKRVKFSQESLDDLKNFEIYYIEEGKSPDDVSYEIYGDPSFWWVVLLANNIYDANEDWPKSVARLHDEFSKGLSGESYFFMENIDFKNGDYIVKRLGDGSEPDFSKSDFAIVDHYDSIFRKVNVKKTGGTISALDDVYIFRPNDSGEWNSEPYMLGVDDGVGATCCAPQFHGATYCSDITEPDSNIGPHCPTGGSQYARVQRKETILSGVEKFEFDNFEMNPYSEFVNINGSPFGATGDFFSFQSICGFTSTILYKYIAPDESGSENYATTVEEDLYKRNDAKRSIRILNPDLLGRVLTEIRSMLNSPLPRGSSISIGNESPNTTSQSGSSTSY